MRVVYLAGPYRDPTEYVTHRNIRAAEDVALGIWQLGAVCLCPHKNTAHFGGALPDEVWLDGDLELLRRCDAVFMMETSWKSSGALKEKALAESISLPVFTNFYALERWLKQ